MRPSDRIESDVRYALMHGEKILDSLDRGFDILKVQKHLKRMLWALEGAQDVVKDQLAQ